MGEMILPWVLLALCCAITNFRTLITLVLAAVTALLALAIASTISEQMQLAESGSLMSHLLLVLAGNAFLLFLLRRRVAGRGIMHILSALLGVAIAVDASGYMVLEEPVTLSLLVAHDVHILLIASVLQAGAYLAIPASTV